MRSNLLFTHMRVTCVNTVLCAQVITALTKAVDADQRQAVQFATTVDREVRNVLTNAVK